MIRLNPIFGSMNQILDSVIWGYSCFPDCWLNIIRTQRLLDQLLHYLNLWSLKFQRTLLNAALMEYQAGLNWVKGENMPIRHYYCPKCRIKFNSYFSWPCTRCGTWMLIYDSLRHPINEPLQLSYFSLSFFQKRHQ